MLGGAEYTHTKINKNTVMCAATKRLHFRVKGTSYICVRGQKTT